MSKTGLVLVVLYLLSSPVNLQQNEDDQAFFKIESPTLTRVLRGCHNCEADSTGHCGGPCCQASFTCQAANGGCACVITTHNYGLTTSN
uniref:Conotoxin-like unassigned superfamily 09 n=1 Tax=Conus ermineus TaxID=55423 RepID=A0A346CIQ6_CONER|nr:conotoxin-like precursor unassigned superfamily 09 [Conus ermineus]